MIKFRHKSVPEETAIMYDSLSHTEELRPLLLTYAYNICGSWEESKDIVQEVFLQFMRVDASKVIDKKAYLIRMVINHALNVKQKQKKLAKTYRGQWLPEPIAPERSETAVHHKEILSYSLMVLLEKLNARQRAVFILKEAFDYEHSEIADLLEITIEHSRKILSRAKKQLQDESKGREALAPDANFLDRYLEVIRLGDIQRLEQLLQDDIQILSDGGGKVSAALNPIVGKKSVVAFLLGLYKKFHQHIHIELGSVNHHPALFYYEEGRLKNCHIFAFKQERVQQMYMVRNPDKLRALQKND